MKFHVGDTVRVKPDAHQIPSKKGVNFVKKMLQYEGKTSVVIQEVRDDIVVLEAVGNGAGWHWRWDPNWLELVKKEEDFVVTETDFNTLMMGD